MQAAAIAQAGTAAAAQPARRPAGPAHHALVPAPQHGLAARSERSRQRTTVAAAGGGAAGGGATGKAAGLADLLKASQNAPDELTWSRATVVENRWAVGAAASAALSSLTTAARRTGAALAPPRLNHTRAALHTGRRRWMAPCARCC